MILHLSWLFKFFRHSEKYDALILHCLLPALCKPRPQSSRKKSQKSCLCQRALPKEFSLVESAQRHMLHGRNSPGTFKMCTEQCQRCSSSTNACLATYCFKTNSFTLNTTKSLIYNLKSSQVLRQIRQLQWAETEIEQELKWSQSRQRRQQTEMELNNKNKKIRNQKSFSCRPILKIPFWNSCVHPRLPQRQPQPQFLLLTLGRK